jgi:hypothetical protein
VAAPAHLLLPALADTALTDAVVTDTAATATTETDTALSKPMADPSAATHLSAFSAEGACAEAPLTSEPPLPVAEPLTSEPPLAETAPLTSESAAEFADTDPAWAEV